MISEGEIEANDIHAGVKHLAHGLRVVAAGPQRPNNRRLALIQIDLLKDVLKANA